MTTPSSLVIRTHNKYRSLTTPHAYKRGEIICPIPTESLYDTPNQFTVQIGVDQHVEVKELASMNHSCNPTTLLDTTRMLVFAASDLASGDELTFFYPSTEWEMSSPFDLAGQLLWTRSWGSYPTRLGWGTGPRHLARRTHLSRQRQRAGIVHHRTRQTHGRLDLEDPPR